MQRNLSVPFCQGPNALSPDKPTLSGHANYITGASGYLQNISNGFLGLRYTAHRLHLCVRCRLESHLPSCRVVTS